MAYAENFRGGAIPRGDNHLWRHTIYDNHVTSQINFRGSAEDTTILGGSGDMPPGKFCKIAPKNTHFCAFWKQVLDNTVFTFFYFEGLRGWPWHSGLPLRTLVGIRPNDGMLSVFCLGFPLCSDFCLSLLYGNFMATWYISILFSYGVYVQIHFKFNNFHVNSILDSLVCWYFA